MFVKKILQNVATLLQLKNVAKFLKSADFPDVTEELADEINLLVDCVNFVNNIIATDYIQLKKTVSIATKNGKIPFTDLSQSTIYNIVSVKDSSGNKLVFKVFPEYLKTVVGNVFVSFAFFPDDVELTGSVSDYATKLSERIFAYGVASEYLFIKGNIDDAAMWNERFKQGLKIITRPMHNVSLKSNNV